MNSSTKPVELLGSTFLANGESFADVVKKRKAFARCVKRLSVEDVPPDIVPLRSYLDMPSVFDGPLSLTSGDTTFEQGPAWLKGKAYSTARANNKDWVAWAKEEKEPPFWLRDFLFYVKQQEGVSAEEAPVEERGAAAVEAAAAAGAAAAAAERSLTKEQQKKVGSTQSLKDLKETAKGLGVAISGTKAALSQRITDHYKAYGDEPLPFSEGRGGRRGGAGRPRKTTTEQAEDNAHRAGAEAQVNNKRAKTLQLLDSLLRSGGDNDLAADTRTEEGGGGDSGGGGPGDGEGESKEATPAAAAAAAVKGEDSSASKPGDRDTPSLPPPRADSVFSVGKYKGHRFEHARYVDKDWCLSRYGYTAEALDAMGETEILQFREYLDSCGGKAALHKTVISGDELMLFGQHSEKTFALVAATENAYCSWCLGLKDAVNRMAYFVRFLKQEMQALRWKPVASGPRGGAAKRAKGSYTWGGGGGYGYGGGYSYGGGWSGAKRRRYGKW